MRFWKEESCDLEQTWEKEPAYAEQLIYIEGGFVPNTVHWDWSYACVFKAFGTWYIHSEGCWKSGSIWGGGAYTRALAGVTDDNLEQFLKEIKEMRS